MKTYEIFVNYKDTEIWVQYEFSPEEPMVMYYPDGSGYSGSPEEFNIVSVKVQDVELVQFFTDGQLIEIEETIKRCYEDNSDY